MKILSFSISNFGSYRKLSFDVADNGLCLIYGPTGSGKSTFQDAPCWILYGVTAKDGGVDEIKSWQGKGPTKGLLELSIDNSQLTVVRVRGTSSQNDLYFVESTGKTIRGKDITETQVLLEKRVGVSKNTYIAGCYFHEFSNSGTFFTDKAKDRRALFERIASLDFTKTIAENATLKVKELAKKLEGEEIKLSNTKSKLSILKTELQSTSTNEKQWNKMRDAKVADCLVKYKEFDKLKQKRVEELTILMHKHTDAQHVLQKQNKIQLKSLQQELESTKTKHSVACPTCKREYESTNTALIEYKIKQLSEFQPTLNPYNAMVTQALNQVNHYAEQMSSLANEVNPITAEHERLLGLTGEISFVEDLLTNVINTTTDDIADYETIKDLANGLRGQILEDSVKQIQMTTNEYLNRYFDSEIKVDFKLHKLDDLKVSIQKSGYDCVYTQLSKGQRGLLKLCFAVAIMKATSDRAGVHFEQLFFDEALDGLDTDMKLKAFSLFEELSLTHSSIYLIDHSPEFQNMFQKKFEVSLIEDYSSVEEVS